MFWVMTDSGPMRLCVADQSAIVFVPSDSNAEVDKAISALKGKVRTKALELRTFDGRPVSAVYADTTSDYFTALDQIRHRGVEVFEADIRPHDRYLMERFAFGSVEFVGEVNSRNGYVEVQRCRIRPGDYRASPRLLSLDIECARDGALYSVGLAGHGCPASVSEVLMIGRPEPAGSTRILWFPDESTLIKALAERICQIDPDLIVGWNLVNFDMRILLQRAQSTGQSFDIGRDGSPASWRNLRGEVEKGYVSIAGRLAIDGIDALRSATWSFPSFSLEHVARTLLGRGKKVEKDADQRMSEIEHNFIHDKPSLAAYNLEDCRLVLDIFAHTRIIDYLLLRGQITGLELDRAGGSVMAFTNLYLPRLHRAGYIAPNLPEDGGLTSPGGYVMDSIPGLYRNVLVLDFKSLYPSIIRTFKIDPVGLIEGLAAPQDAIPGFRGGVFHRDRHFLPEIITDLWQKRDQAKAENDATRSQAIKILMNSFYGVLGSGGCRFYDPRLASSITMRGHEIMLQTRRWIESEGYEVIYGDTDSTFVSLDEDLEQSECRKIGSYLASTINKKWQETIGRDYQIESFLEIEFETCFSRFLMPTIRGSDAGSKKRYAGLLIETKTGTEKVIYKGLESVRTDWTQLAKTFQEELYDLVFHDQDPAPLVRKTVEDTAAGRLDHMLVYRKQLRRRLAAYVKNVPPHVRAARLADQTNEALGKPLRYQNKGWVSYVMTLGGPEPLEYLKSPIDYDHYIDRQLKPVADGILPFVGLQFDAVVSAQAELF